MKTAAYPKPGAVGGRLIRQVIGEMKAQGLRLPLNSHILIAVSGGSDSLGLARLLIRYGRRIASADKISVLHIDHGWRAEASARDARFVKKLAGEWGVPFITVGRESFVSPRKRGSSLEEHARQLRKQVYALLGERHEALVLTAHQADDVAETLLWRLLTGAAATHGGGIHFREGRELRPLLRIRKSQLQQFLKEEGLKWREDSTNSDGKLMRSKMRGELMPILEKLFPRAVEHLVEAALKAQSQMTERNLDLDRIADFIFRATGQRLRRPHLENVNEGLVRPEKSGEVHLPGGWKLLKTGRGLGRNVNR
jgi:tRNA(Ile)-lysidine synthase